jgi:predicted nucleic acid-binding protein
VIVVDASVLIAHLDERDALHERAVERLLAAAGEALGASTLTLAKVFVGPARRGRLDDARTAIAALEVEEIPLAPGAAGDLATLRAETGLKLPDCCVLLAARDARASGVLTFDERLAKAAARPLA